MYPVSQDINDILLRGVKQSATLRVTPIVGEPFVLTSADILDGGVELDRYCITGDAFEIGTATAAELTLRLSNHDHRFDAVVFEGAEIFASLSFTYTDEIRKLKTESGYVLTTEYGVGIELEAYNLSPSDEEPPRIDIPVGMFIVDNSPRRTSTIELTALDRMVRFDKSADRSRFVFPCTLKELLLTICSVCNVRLADPSLKGLLNADYIVQEYPTGDNLTYRQLLIWIAQIACAYAYMDWDGLLRLDWYQTTTPGLVLTEAQRATSDIQQDSEIAIQRLEVTDTNGDVFIGKGMDAEDGYALRVENRLIQSEAQSIADNIASRLSGFSYVPFNAKVRAVPHLYPTDMLTYVRAGKSYVTVLTNVHWTINASTELAAKGQSKERNGYASLNPFTGTQGQVVEHISKDISDAQTELRRQASAAVALNETAANAMGLFYTERKDENGGIIRYWHDAKNLEDSKYITMQNAGGSFSTNSGWNNGKPVWTQGADKYGNALYSLLDAIGIQAEWIRAGSISTDKLSIGLKERGTNLLEDGSFEHNVPWTDNEYDEQGQLIEYRHNDAWRYAAFWLDDVQTRKAKTATADTEKPQKPTFDIGGFDGGKYREENFKGYASDAEPLWMSGVEQLEDIAVEPITHTLSLYGRVRNIPKISAEANGIFAAKMQWLDLNHKPIGAEIKQFHISSTEPGWQRRHTTVTPPNGAKYVRFAIGATCPDLEHYGQDDYAGAGYYDVAYIGIDGVMLEPGTALQAWTCSAKEAKNTGVVIDANGLNIADGKIIIQDGHGRRVLYTDGNGNLQFTGSLKTEVLSPDKQKIYGDMTVESYEIANDGLSGYLGLNFRRYAKERNRFETVGNMMMYYPPAETAGAGYCSLNISAEGGVGINGQSNVFLSQPYEELSENRNLDDITDPGYYYCGASSIVETFKNVPEKTAFWLRVERFGGHGNAVIQTFTPVNLNNEYKRWYQPWEPVGWQEWRLSSQMHAMSPADSKLLTGTDLVGQLAPGVYMVHEADIRRAQDEDAPESYNGLLYYPTRADGLLECWHPSEGGVFQRYTTVDGRVYARYQTVGGWWNRWYTS